MGWLLINILLPVGVPLVYLLGAKLVDLPEPYASRVKPVRAVQDGQLGWVGTVLSAGCVYELLHQLQGRKDAPVWVGSVFAISCGLIALSGFLAIMGTLYPLKESNLEPTGLRDWIQHYRLFVATALVVAISAALLSLTHFALPNYPACH